MAEPIIAFNLLFGLTLLRNAAIMLTARCIAGIEANRERCLEYVQNSIGLVTALNPVLGYEKSAAIAKEALVTNRQRLRSRAREKSGSPKSSSMTSSNPRT